MLTFAPDAIDIAPEVLQECSAVPTVRGYRNPPAGVDLAVAALAAAPVGCALLPKLDGTTRTIAATATRIYERSAATWTDISRGALYTVGSNRWRYAIFGNTSLACNKAEVLQSGTTGAFADVANAPKAAFIEIVGGFVMLANTNDSGLGITGGPNEDQPHRWWCSQSYNPTGTYAPSASTLATTGLLVETPGPITGLRRLGNDAAIYKERGVYIGRYVQGSAEVWRWQCMSRDVGCTSHEAVVAVGSRNYFMGDADFYAFDGGSEPQPIGTLIKRWFFGRLNRSYTHTVQALHDRSEKIVYWFYPSGSSTTLNSCLAYHYDTQRWGAFDISVRDVLDTVTAALTYDDLPSLFASYDAIPSTLSYDSPLWSAATPLLAYFSTTNFLTSLSGVAMSMTYTTGFFGAENEVSLCTRVRPRYRTKPSSASLVGYTVMKLGDTPELATSATTLTNGRYDVLQAANFHRFAVTDSGSTEVEAVTPYMQPEGDE